MTKKKVKILASYHEITKIEIIRETPEGIYLKKVQEAFGRICKELDFLGAGDLKSINLSSWSDKEKHYSKYIIIFNKTFNHPNDITSKIRNIFEYQDWGEKIEDGL
jgi:hypothetical protein